MILLFGDLKSFGDGIALLDEFLLLVNEGVSVGKSIELPTWIGLVANGLVLEIRVPLKEVVDELGVQILIRVDFDLASAVLERLRVFCVHEVGVAVVLGRDDTVFHEVLHARLEVHTRPPTVVHQILWPYIKSSSALPPRTSISCCI